MGERVLLALGERGDEVAEALRDAGLAVERCGPARVTRALAEGGAALVLCEVGRSSPGWAREAGAPTWIALCADGDARRLALEAGTAAVLVALRAECAGSTRSRAQDARWTLAEGFLGEPSRPYWRTRLVGLRQSLDSLSSSQTSLSSSQTSLSCCTSARAHLNPAPDC